jgi:O-antigen ligase
MTASAHSPPTSATSHGSSVARGLSGARGALGILALGALLGAAALGPPLPAVLAIAALAGVSALLLVAAIVPGRLFDLLYFTALAAAAVPLDKYFGYRDHVGGWAGLRFALSDIFALLLAPLALVGWRHGRLKGLPAALVAPYALLLLQYGASLLGAPDRALAAFEIASAVHCLSVAAVVAALFARRHLGPLMLAQGGMVLIHTALAVAQVATGRPLGAGLLRQRAEVMKEVLETGSVHLRPSGLFDHPIVFADFILLSLPVLAAGAMALSRPAARAAVKGALFTGLVGLMLTLSRGAWISSLVSGAVFLALAVRLRLLPARALQKVGAAAVLVALPIALALGPRIYERLTESQAGNFRVRLELNEIALSMVSAHPVVGIGLNNFLSEMPKYDPKNVARYFPATVHNLFLLEASEAGIPALLLFLAPFAGLLLWALRRLPSVEDPGLRWLGVAIASGLVGFAFSQLADFSYRLEPLRTVLWTQIGVLVGAVRAGLPEGRA